ncbi:trimeric intracellular cation channel family protein, partial [Burkholderia sp. E168m23]
MKRIEQVVLAADLAGTAVFAIEGANAAIGAGLDLFGVMVLSLVVALGGGVIRDLLIGARPPSAVSDWRYPALAFAAGLFAFVFHARVASFSPSLLTTLDAAGLALFAVAGAVKALEFRVHPFIATLMGAVTGCGGGVVRDL